MLRYIPVIKATSPLNEKFLGEIAGYVSEYKVIA